MAFTLGSQATDSSNEDAVRKLEIEDIYYKLLERIITNFNAAILKGRPFCNAWCDKRKALADTYNSIFRTATVRMPTRESIWAKARDLHSYDARGREIAIATYITQMQLSPEQAPYTAKGVFNNRNGKGRKR